MTKRDEAIDSMYRWIACRHEREPVRDHACAECVPGGDIVIPGFACVPHRALRALALPRDEPDKTLEAALRAYADLWKWAAAHVIDGNEAAWIHTGQPAEVWEAMRARGIDGRMPPRDEPAGERAERDRALVRAAVPRGPFQPSDAYIDAIIAAVDHDALRIVSPPPDTDQARAEEHERCARECEAVVSERVSSLSGDTTATLCAARIRALGPAARHDEALLMKVAEEVRKVCAGGGCAYWPSDADLPAIIARATGARS